MIKKSAIFVLALLLFGCGGSEETSTKNSNRANSAKPAQQSRPADNTTVTADANSQNGVNADENPLTIARNKKIEAMRKNTGDPNAPKPDIETVLRQSTRPAPENSEFSVALTDILVERRTFLKHPTLAKVEKTTISGKKSIKVFLKDGRVLDLPGDSLESLSTVSSFVILRTAGIETPPQQAPGAEVKKNAPAKN